MNTNFICEYDIPFCVPHTVGNELNYIQQAIQSHHLCGDGAFNKKVEAQLELSTGAKRALLTTSCTHALEMSAILLNIKPGDEVIVPSFTFVSTVNAFVLRGARPVFVDIRPDTLNLDEKLVPQFITKKTKAIVLVHYAGIACEMKTFLDISKKYNVPLVEDNAHGLFGKYDQKPLGSFGRFSTLSFHETKNITCGEGGSLLLNQEEDILRAEIIREKGTNRTQFFRREITKYEWKDLGSSYVLSDILGAFLYAQIEKHEEIQSKRKSIFQSYYQGLKEWAHLNGIQMPTIPNECEPAYHLFYLLFSDRERRDQFITHLRAKKINPTFHYVPLHRSEMGISFSGLNQTLPITESVSERLVRLPFYNSLQSKDIQKVIDATLTFEKTKKSSLNLPKAA